MKRTRRAPEQIIANLRKVDVLVGQGKTAAEAIREIGITETTYYKWRKEYRGMSVAEVKRLKALEKENARALNLNRSGVRYKAVKLPDEDDLTEAIIRKACEYGRYGYRPIARMIELEGFHVNHKRVERIWREQGLKVPSKQPKKKRLFATDGNVIRLRAQHPNHVWSYDFAWDHLSNGRKLRWLNIIDEYTRECLASIPARSWRGNAVIKVLAEIMAFRKAPEYIRSDNGPEFAAKKLRDWLAFCRYPDRLH